MKTMRWTASAAVSAMKKHSRPQLAKAFDRFFKTFKGGYGEGDRFLGVKVPETRSVARRFARLPLAESEKLLTSKWHEVRLLSLVILGQQMKNASEAERRRIFSVYMRNLKHVNNWDLVDASAPHIAGVYLDKNKRAPLYKLARSKDLWKKRVAMLATFHFIRQGDMPDALRIAEMLRNDDHDLIHKAVGWMLREVGNRDLRAELQFLDRYAASMPRTMLRYAIEKFPEPLRLRYMKRKASAAQA